MLALTELNDEVDQRAQSSQHGQFLDDVVKRMDMLDATAHATTIATVTVTVRARATAIRHEPHLRPSLRWMLCFGAVVVGMVVVVDIVVGIVDSVLTRREVGRMGHGRDE